MDPLKKFAAEAGATAALVLVLLGVWLIDPRTAATGKRVEIDPNKMLPHKVIYGDPAVMSAENAKKGLRLGVTPKQYDDLGKLLGVPFDVLEEADLEAYDLRSRFDVIFLTCKEVEVNPRAAQALRYFVIDGGTLYASDLRANLVRAAFPEYVDQAGIAGGLLPGKGEIKVKAHVTDPGLLNYLGKNHLFIDFPVPGWEPAAFKKPLGTSILEGKYFNQKGDEMLASLLFKFQPPETTGSVIFTSFHNEANNSPEVKRVLDYLVFKTINAQAEIKMSKRLENEGLKQTAGNLISASKESAAVTSKYVSKNKGRLRFSLAFEPGRGKLQLNVKAPGAEGKELSVTHNSTFTVEVPNAEVGEWTYSVSAAEVDAGTNLNFQVFVGEEAPAVKSAAPTLAKLGRELPKDRELAQPTKLDFSVVIGEANPAAEIKPLRLAITEQVYDDMGVMLRSMGKGFEDLTIIPKELLPYERLKKFDVIFVTCATAAENKETAEALRKFVENGGTIYASDLRCRLVQMAFRGFVDENALDNGVAPGRANQTVNARIVDPGLKQFLGKDSLGLLFTSPGWEPATFLRDKCTVYLRGKYFPVSGGEKESPLMVKFQPTPHSGSVIFTSFHNAEQPGADIKKLLEFLIFRTVTAQSELKLSAQMKLSGVVPTHSKLATTKENSSATETYTSKKQGKLRFGLAFNPGEGKLRLEVKGPGGKVAKAEHNSSFTIEIENAPVGEWTYTITTVQVPPNATLGFNIIVGEEK